MCILISSGCVKIMQLPLFSNSLFPLKFYLSFSFTNLYTTQWSLKIYGFFKTRFLNFDRKIFKEQIYKNIKTKIETWLKPFFEAHQIQFQLFAWIFHFCLSTEPPPTTIQIQQQCKSTFNTHCKIVECFFRTCRTMREDDNNETWGKNHALLLMMHHNPSTRRHARYQYIHLLIWI